MLQTEEISDLADNLRREGFRPSLYQILAAQAVVHQESQREADLGSLVRLTTLLRPIFSSTPEEQGRFEKLYLEWLRARSGRPHTISYSPSRTTPAEKLPTHWRLKLAAAGLVVLPSLTSWFLWQDLRPREAVGRAVADNEPVAQATVRLGEQTVTTDNQGTFKLPFKNSDMPLQLLVEMKGYLPNQSLAGQTILKNRKWFYLAAIEWDAQYQIGDLQLTKEASKITRPSPPPAPAHESTPLKLSLDRVRSISPALPPWWERLSYSTALAVFIPGLLVLVWLLWRFSRRAVLKRQSSRIPSELKQVQVKISTQHMFPSLSLRHVTQRLRQTRFEESSELDVPRTIHRTMNRGGLFTPVFGSKREPGYVALIDRATVADHQANVAAQMVKDLAKGYVLVRQYEFDEQPTMLRRVDPLRPEPKKEAGTMAMATMVEVMSLGEVTAKFPTSRLLCFADPMTCFDPLTGKIRSWVETLEVWKERFLFSQSTHGQWTQAERILSRRGFQVIPLSHLGLRLFSQLLEQSRSSPLTTSLPARGQWGIYDQRPERWLERHPPPQETITRLLYDLRKELGSDGMLWLAACSAYPEIHWALTLEWSVRLFESGHISESLLPKLTPLIWFRHAFMPDWFRMALYDRLTAQQADRISQELSDIISALNPERDNVLQLYIATQLGAKQEAPAPDGRFSAWFQKFRRRSAIQEMGRAADPGSPMRDYVMLQYLSGKQGMALTPYAPKALLMFLFPKGRPWLGFRPAFLVMAAGLVCTGLWWWLDPVLHPVPSPIRDVGFLPDKKEIVVQRASGSYERWGDQGQGLELLESGEAAAFADRLSRVKMGQIILSDPANVFNLAYEKEGHVRLTVREDGREVAQEAVPPSPVASLHWPAGAEPYLAVAPGEVPELLILNGLGELHPMELARRDEERAAAEARRKEAAAKMAEAQRQSDSAPRKKSIKDSGATVPETTQRQTAKVEVPEQTMSSEQESQLQQAVKETKQRGDTEVESPKQYIAPKQEDLPLQQAIKEPGIGITAQDSKAPTATAPPPAPVETAKLEPRQGLGGPAGRFSNKVLSGQVFYREGTASPKPMEGAVVSIVNVGNPYVTGNDGAYRIFVPDVIQFGQTIRLNVQKRGWIIDKPEGGQFVLPFDLVQNIFLLPESSSEFLSVAHIDEFLLSLPEKLKVQVKPGGKREEIDPAQVVKDYASEHKIPYQELLIKVEKRVESYEKEGDSRQRCLAAFYRNDLREIGTVCKAKAEEGVELLKKKREEYERLKKSRAEVANPISSPKQEELEAPQAMRETNIGITAPTRDEQISNKAEAGQLPNVQGSQTQILPRVSTATKADDTSTTPAGANPSPFGIPAQESTVSGIQPTTSPSVAKVFPAPNVPIHPERSKAAREITGRDGAPMVLIPAGEFSMGSPDGKGDDDEHPRHKVGLDAFYLDKYEVTNKRFEKFVNDTGHRTRAEKEGKAYTLTSAGWKEVNGASWRKPEGGDTVFVSNREEHPVVSVSWDDAESYCRWAGKRLPTEAEFEYATRAGTETEYWWGDGNSGSRRVANIADESGRRQLSMSPIMEGYDDGYVRTAPVGSYEANPFGLHDTIGNAWEWTADWYDKDYYGKSPKRNPTGPPSGTDRVLRGGSWHNPPKVVRSANRYSYSPSAQDGDYGFRCAEDIPK